MGVTYLGDQDGMYRRYCEDPILNQTIEFIKSGKETKFVKDELRWEYFYKGGISYDKHLEIEHMRVLYRDIPKMKCLKCDSQKDCKIMFVQGNVHPMTGDAYYDVEIYCNKCKIYSAFSYAEN